MSRDDGVAIPAAEHYAKRARHYLAERGLDKHVLAAVPVHSAVATRATSADDLCGIVRTEIAFP